MDEQPQYFTPGARVPVTGQLERAYWFAKCPACGEIHERIVKVHWDDRQGWAVEGHSIVCMTTKTTFFISSVYPYEVLREVHFGLTKDPAAHGSDEPIPF